MVWGGRLSWGATPCLTLPHRLCSSSLKGASCWSGVDGAVPAGRGSPYKEKGAQGSGTPSQCLFCVALLKRQKGKGQKRNRKERVRATLTVSVLCCLIDKTERKGTEARQKRRGDGPSNSVFSALSHEQDRKERDRAKQKGRKVPSGLKGDLVAIEAKDASYAHADINKTNNHKSEVGMPLVEPSSPELPFSLRPGANPCSMRSGAPRSSCDMSWQSLFDCRASLHISHLLVKGAPDTHCSLSIKPKT